MQRLVILSGAGISAESGLKTFRDSDGLWEGYEVTEVATPGAFRRNPQLVLDFYNMRRRNVLDAVPNAAHTGLAALEKDFEVIIITQNIDDLHERGGSTHVLHLHGEITKTRSISNPDVTFSYDRDLAVGDLAPDGTQLRPFIVWFEEEVPKLAEAAAIMRTADIMAVIGTSLLVYPAAGLVHYARPGIQKYIIDKRIPAIEKSKDWNLIEKPATEGVIELQKLLRR
ncbi:MAG: Sir2 family NAD-dependent protein deacetylase [Chitinophagaceae bacterium]